MADDDPIDVIASADERESDKISRSGTGLEVGFLLLILGLALGAVFASFGLELFAQNAAVIFSAMFGLVLFLIIIFVALIMLRRSIWSRVFRRTEIEIDRLARPLSEVAEHAARKDVPKASGAARDLAEIVLARYAWLTTRRWLIASITGMIAAIAALAGSALLFQQNELLRKQGDSLIIQTQLLREQNLRIDEQIGLLQTDAQLTDSGRSANILGDIVEASARLGDEVERLTQEGRQGDDGQFRLEDISLSLRNQLITITNTVRPYYYLKSDIANANTDREMRDIALGRRDDLPKVKESLGVKEVEPVFGLIDRPTSPERGAVINALYNSRVWETEALSFFGADFSYAEFSIPKLFKMTFRHANLRFSDFRAMELRAVDFGAAGLENARFIDSYLTSVNFKGHEADKAPGLFRTPGETFVYNTQTSGIQFRNSMIYNSDFGEIIGFAQDFDNSLIVNTSFAGASMAAATFRNSILLNVDFTDAFLPKVAFDGAIVFDAQFIDRVNDQAQQGSFDPSRFELEPVPPTGLNDIDLLEQFGIRITEASISDRQAYRIKLVKPYEE